MKRNVYDEIDLSHNYTIGFWIGAVSGISGLLVIEAITAWYLFIR